MSQLLTPTLYCPYCAGHGYEPTSTGGLMACPLCRGQPTSAILLPTSPDPEEDGSMPGEQKHRNAIPTLGARLAELRTKAGLSRERLAADSGTSFSAISMLERGERYPSLEMAARLARVLGCLVDDLLLPTGSPVRRPKRISEKVTD